MNEKPSAIVGRGFVGVLATAGGIVVSYIQEVEVMLRIASLAIGVVVGVATFISLWCKMRRDERRFKHEEEMWQKQRKEKTRYD